MHVLFCLLLLMSAGVRPAAAQTFTVDDPDASRAGLIAGYAGHGLDVQASLESRMLWDRVRFRAAIGHGRWDETLEDGRLLQALPRVTRLAVSVLRFTPPDRYVAVRGYAGAGFTWLKPHGLRLQRGVHVMVGVEAMGERWTVGPELAAELPVPEQAWDLHPGRPRRYLAPAARISIGVKRRF